MAKGKQKNKERNFFIWFLFAIIVPIILVVVLTIAVLSLIGYDVTGWVKDKANKAPVISTFVTSDQEEEIQGQLSQANEKIQNQEEEISSLEYEITSLEEIIDEQRLDITKLKNRDKSSEALDGDGAVVNDEVKQVASSFRKMDEVKAAKIVENLDKATAMEVLSEVSGDVRGVILAEMEPKQAAELMEGMLQ